jgi:outer membrane protein, multidrug efflux system
LKYTNLFLIVFLGLMTGCSVGPSYIPPCIEVPAEWKNKNEESCNEYDSNKEGEFVYLDFWWQVFDDNKLNELESLAVERNRNLFVAFERVQEYRSLMGIAAADFYPQLTLSPLYTNMGELIKIYANNAGGAANALNIKNVFRAHELLYYLPVNMSYEVDLWGKIRDQYDYAKYNWLAQKKDYESLMLILTTDLAFTYYQLRASDAQIDLLSSVLQTRQKALAINQDRYDAKITFYADVALAAEEVDSALLQYNEVVRQRNVLEDQIAVLIGVPASEFCLEHLPLEGLPPCIPEGLPSEILLRRPDIAEAEYNIRAAHALIKQAYSQFFPSLTLTAIGGYESPVFKDFLRWISRYWFEGAQINQLIFDGLRTPYNLQLQIARFQEASGSYQQLVLTAFQEVEDALTNIESYANEYDNAWSATQWAQKANQLYIDRYIMGVIYYIDVVNTERDLLNFQINLNALQGYRYIATIQLIKALGGGWSQPNYICK